MPRRNKRPERRRPLRRELEEKPLTYQAMAVDLVRRGLASPLILGPLPAWKQFRTAGQST